MLKALFFVAGCCLAQTSESLPTFEVASVKAVPERERRPTKIHGGPGTDIPGYIYATDYPLSVLIQKAYEVKWYQFVYPHWMDDARYDLSAKVPEGASKHDANLMMRQLLMERLELKAHRENREMAVYELRVAKGGLKMSAVSEDSEPTLTEARLRKELPESAPMPPPEVLRAGVLRMFHSSGARMIFSKQPMERLADALSVTVVAGASGTMDRPVLDRTDTPGLFSFVLSWNDGRDAELGVSLITAIQQQLGLRLEPGRAAIEVLVVDSARKIPIEN